MRENRTCGSEGGEALRLPYPYERSPCAISSLRNMCSLLPAPD